MEAARSAELEKLLLSSGAIPAVTYDAEVMIDELLVSSWQPGGGPPRRGSAFRTGGVGSTTRSSAATFTQQTSALNALQDALMTSIDRLLKHREVVSARIAALEKENQSEAKKYPDALAPPEQLLQQICVQMEDLEERFTKVSATAVSIGDRLCTLDTERTRVLETDEVMDALLVLNEHSSSLSGPNPSQNAKSSNRLVQTLQDPTQRHEASRVIKRMSALATELVSSPALAVAVSEIERLSQVIENDLLQEFSDAQEKRQEPAMRACASSLIEYNDQEKVADRYVWNVMNDLLSKTMNNAAFSSINPIQDLESLFGRIRGICEDQFLVIDHVFPVSSCNSVRELLVERLFNDPAFGILCYLDQFLTRPRRSASTEVGSLASATNENAEYVQLLCTAYERTCDLALSIEKLKNTATKMSVVVPVDSSAVASAISNNAELDQDERMRADAQRMRTFLNLQLHSLFGSHQERYFDTELELAQSRFRDTFAAAKFPQPFTAKQKAAASRGKGGTATTNVPSTSSSATTPGVPSASTSSSNFDKDSISADMGLIFYDTLLSTAESEAIPEAYAEAIRESISRCKTVLKDSELCGELITKLFSSFTSSFGDEYLNKIAGLANSLLQEPLLSTESAKQFFNVLECVLKGIDFLEEQFEALIAPSQTSSPTQLTICFETKRKCLDKLEHVIGTGLQQVLVVVDKHLGQILSTTQDKTDFIGSETNMSLSCSRACKKCGDYLQPLVKVISTVLLEENRDRFLVAHCSLFKDLYLQHLQRFRFDPDGACMLLRDVNAYRQVFRTLRHAAIDDTFDILHEVANLYALPPENVAGFIRDGNLSKMSKQSLMDVIKRRWDYKTHGDKIMLS